MALLPRRPGPEKGVCGGEVAHHAARLFSGHCNGPSAAADRLCVTVSVTNGWALFCIIDTRHGVLLIEQQYKGINGMRETPDQERTR